MDNYNTSYNPIMYYDTIKISRRQTIDPVSLDLWGGYKRDPKRLDRRERYWDSRETTAGEKLRFGYYPEDMNKNIDPLTEIEFSIPKMENDCNHRPLDWDEFWSAVTKVAEIITTKHPEIMNFTLSDWYLSRVDCTINFDVGKRLPEYLNVIPYIPYPKRSKVKAYPYSGVQFPSTNHSLTFYDKQQKCNCPDAYGLLRMESSLRDANFISDLVGKDYPTVYDLTAEFPIRILETDLQRLNLDKGVTYDRDEALDLLVDQYGRRGIDLYGFLAFRQGKSRKQVMDGLQITRQTVHNCEKAIKEAGMTLAIGKKKSLPALEM